MFLTDIDTSPLLSSKTVNAIENLAINIAAQNDGNLYTLQLVPYFSLPVKQINSCLEAMVDNSSILKLEANGLTYYKFKNLNRDNLPPTNQNVRESSVEGDFRKTKLEHQIVHAAAKITGGIQPASLAANTDFTLQEVKDTLEEMNLNGFIAEKLDEENGSIYYIFPEVGYPERNFEINMHAMLPKGSQESFEANMSVFMRYMFYWVVLIALLAVARVHVRFLIPLFFISMPFSGYMAYLNSKKIQG
ncbi:MAG: hypothetical protein MK132_24620 [Lentisphaerales bacterium]|nr:hypothetical protein [Lentisphaerales bacterium]